MHFGLLLFHLEGWNSALAATCRVLKNLTRTPYPYPLKKRKYPFFLLRIRSLTYASKTYNWLYDVIYVSNNVVTGVIKPTQFMVEIFIGPLISMQVSFLWRKTFSLKPFLLHLFFFIAKSILVAPSLTLIESEFMGLRKSRLNISDALNQKMHYVESSVFFFLHKMCWNIFRNFWLL